MTRHSTLSELTKDSLGSISKDDEHYYIVWLQSGQGGTDLCRNIPHCPNGEHIGG